MTQVAYDERKHEFVVRKIEDARVLSARKADVYGVDTITLMDKLTRHPNEWYTLGDEHQVRNG